MKRNTAHFEKNKTGVSRRPQRAGYLSFLLVAPLLLILSSAAFGMEFSFGPSPYVPADRSASWLHMTGPIVSGDSERFRQFMTKNISVFKSSGRNVWLSSNGGNISEALKIASLIKAMYVSVNVVNSKCTSSCIFIYLNGLTRFAEPGTIGIHRAFFESSYVDGLSASQMQKQQTELTASINKLFADNNVPQYLIEKMNQTASSEVYWLDAADIKRLGIRQAWYEEMLIAKCRLDKPLEDVYLATADRSLWPDHLKTNIQGTAACAQAAIRPELDKIAPLLRRPALPKQAQARRKKTTINDHQRAQF